jgi:hypothetical protein
MIELLTNPTVTMAVSAVAGYLMKLKALDNARRQEERLYTLDALKTRIDYGTKSADAASARANDKYGKATRRFIAFALVIAVIALVFVPGLLDKPSVIETVKESGGWLFGLFPERTNTEFVSVQGFVHMPALLVGFGHVVAFFFGQGAAKA